MQQGYQQKLYTITLVFGGGYRKEVKVKAATRETAERRALKRNPKAVDIHRS
jgi:hypothetical protein